MLTTCALSNSNSNVSCNRLLEPNPNPDAVHTLEAPAGISNELVANTINFSSTQTDLVTETLIAIRNSAPRKYNSNRKSTHAAVGLSSAKRLS